MFKRICTAALLFLSTLPSFGATPPKTTPKQPDTCVDVRVVVEVLVANGFTSILSADKDKTGKVQIEIWVSKRNGQVAVISYPKPSKDRPITIVCITEVYREMKPDQPGLEKVFGEFAGVQA